MKIWHITDLHLDTGKIKLDKVVLPVADCVVITGDLAPKLEGWSFIEYLLKKEYIVIFILGNHEYYSSNRSSILTMSEIEKKWLKKSSENENLHVLINSSVIVKGVKFIGGTLWTDFNKKDLETIKEYEKMSDSNSIFKGYKGVGYKRKGGIAMLPNDILDKHYETKNYIVKELEKPFSGKNIVLSHHAPSAKSIHSKFINDYKSNGLYFSDLEGIIEKNRITAWLHGHIHENKEYYIGETLIHCNPRGYVSFNEVNENFNFGKVIEI